MPSASTRLAAVAALALGVALAGCGRRGDLEPPGAPEARAAPQIGASDEATGLKRRKRIPIAAPKEGFLLDPLL